jgi:hypothetical protein
MSHRLPWVSSSPSLRTRVLAACTATALDLLHYCTVSLLRSSPDLLSATSSSVDCTEHCAPPPHVVITGVLHFHSSQIFPNVTHLPVPYNISKCPRCPTLPLHLPAHSPALTQAFWGGLWVLPRSNGLTGIDMAWSLGRYTCGVKCAPHDVRVPAQPPPKKNRTPSWGSMALEGHTVQLKLQGDPASVGPHLALGY